MRYALSIFTASALAVTCASATEADKKAYRTVIEECLNKGNLAVADKYIAKDMIDHDPSNPMGGLDGFKKFVSSWKSAFPDARTEIQDIISEGDRVMARVRVSGTHTGTFNDIPPTNKKFEIEGFDEVMFRNGKAVEHWAVVDLLGMMKQLGLAEPETAKPKPSAAPAKPAAPGAKKF